MKPKAYILWALIMLGVSLSDMSLFCEPIVNQPVENTLSSQSQVFQESVHKKLSLYSYEDLRATTYPDVAFASEEEVTDVNAPALLSTSKYTSYLNKKGFVKGQTKIIRTKVYYKVKAGDSVYKIARLYKTSAKNIMRMNNMKSDFLREGQRLFVGVREKVIEIPYIDENGIRQDVSSLKETLTVNEENPDSSAQLIGDKIVEIAVQYIGLPYKYGGENLWGIDCSAFVRRVWGFFGLDLPRTSREQYLCGEKTELSDLQPGDLVFFHRRGRKTVSHVGIYIGDSKFIHASGAHHKVTISDLTQEYYRKYFKGARRVINFLFPDLMMTATEEETK